MRGSARRWSGWILVGGFAVGLAGMVLATVVLVAGLGALIVVDGPGYLARIRAATSGDAEPAR